MTTVTIGNLSLLPAPLDTTVFAVEEAGLTKKLSALALKSYMSTTNSVDVSGLINAGGGITANSVSAGTIGNIGSLLVGTLQTNAQPYITSLGTLTSLTVSGNSALGNVSISGTLGVTGNTTLGNTSLGNTIINGTLRVTGVTTTSGIFWANGAVYSTGTGGGGGSTDASALTGTTLASGVTASSLTTVGNLTVLTMAGNIVPSANLTYNLGSTTSYWNIVYGKAVQAQYADLAENYTSVHNYSPGTVVSWVPSDDIDEELIMAQVSHTPLVAGVISTNPAYLMNSYEPGLPLALSGRVPCKVLGPITKGDRLAVVAPGTAGRLDPQLYQPGCVIGYALASVPDGELATIGVVIMKF